jgi:hypothetical protein
MKILAHRKLPDGNYLLRIHLDENRMVQDTREVQAQVGVEKTLVQTGMKDGQPIHEERDVAVMGWKPEPVGDPYPDPDWVEEFIWPPVPRKLDDSGNEGKPEMSEKDYIAQHLREAKLLCEAKLAARTADAGLGKRLNSEGRSL